MKKVSKSMIIFWAFFFIVGSHENPDITYPGYVNNGKKKFGTRKPEPVARWTGTLKREEKITHSNEVVVGTVVRHAEVFFKAALPTMNRDDESTSLIFTDDKGTGNITVHGDMTNLLTKQKCISDCTGSGTAELHTVIIREWDNTYDIEAIVPICRGTTCDGQGGSIAYEEEIMISVSNEKFTDKDVLSGSKTVTAEMPGGLGTGTATTTWVLRRVKEDNDAELIVTPVNYDNWLPEAGRNEISKGNMMTIKLELIGKNGKPLKVKAESFELSLSNTSIEPGITINYPLVPDAKQLPDLRFIHLPNIESIDEDQTIIVGSPDGKTGKAFLASYDGGGWTVLKAEAILTDQTRVEGRLLKPGGEIDIRIPKRDPNSHIGEVWLKKYNNPGEMDDKEKSTGNNYNGDGLTAYEEYRGVISEAKFGKSNPNRFGRLDPQKKELGIYVIKSEQAFFAEGIKLFEKASNLTTILFAGMEIDLSQRRLNKNGKTNHDYDQYVLWLFRSVIPGGRAMGKAYGGPGPPNKTYSVVVDYAVATKEYQYWTRCANEMGVKLPFTLTDLIAKTIAHELGHGVNCWHHGYTKNVKGKVAQEIIEKAGNPYLIINHEGMAITTRPFPIVGLVGEKNSPESGDLSCYMIYQPFYQWSLTIKNNLPAFLMTPLLPLPLEFCTSKYGTGINEKDPTSGENDFFGDARWGNCLAQMKLKD